MTKGNCERTVRRHRNRRQAGFTLVELMVAIAILAIVADIATPSLLRLRVAANETLAILHLRTISTSQELFKTGDKDADGVLDYAISLGELDSELLIDKALGLGRDDGYQFTLKLDAVSNWNAEARPLGRGYAKTGGRSFYVDEDGITSTDRNRAATDKDPLIGDLGTPTPTPTPTPSAPTPGSALTARGLRGIKRLDGLVDGQALQGAKAIVSNPANVAIILEELDTDDDGTIRWGEILGADYVTLARNLVPLLGLSPDQQQVSESDTRAACLAYVKSVSNYVRLEPGENPLPEIVPADVGGNPAALLDLAD